MILTPCVRSSLPLVLLVLVFPLAVACGSEPTPIPTVTLAPTPTATPLPTPTFTPEPTPTATPPPVTASSLESLIPEGAVFVVDIDVLAIVEWSPLAVMIEAMMGAAGSEEGVLDGWQSEDIDVIRSLDRVEIYMESWDALGTLSLDPESQQALDQLAFGAVFHANPDQWEGRSQWQEVLEDEPALMEEGVDYRGYRMFGADADGYENGTWYALPDDYTLLMGTRDGVKAMLDVAAGASKPLSGEGVAALEALGERHLGIIVDSSSIAMDGAGPGGMESMGLMGALGSFGLNAPLSVSKVLLLDDSVQVLSANFFENETDAVAYLEYNEGMLAMVGAMSGSPELQELVAGVEFTHEASKVYGEITIDAASLAAIMGVASMMVEGNVP